MNTLSFVQKWGSLYTHIHTCVFIYICLDYLWKNTEEVGNQVFMVDSWDISLVTMLCLSYFKPCECFACYKKIKIIPFSFQTKVSMYLKKIKKQAKKQLPGRRNNNSICLLGPNTLTPQKGTREKISCCSHLSDFFSFTKYLKRQETSFEYLAIQSIVQEVIVALGAGQKCRILLPYSRPNKSESALY